MITPQIGKFYFVEHQRRIGTALAKCVFIMGTMLTFEIREGHLTAPDGKTSDGPGAEVTFDSALVTLSDRKAGMHV